jgi:hypothetical protein
VAFSIDPKFKNMKMFVLVVILGFCGFGGFSPRKGKWSKNFLES